MKKGLILLIIGIILTVLGVIFVVTDFGANFMSGFFSSTDSVGTLTYLVSLMIIIIPVGVIILVIGIVKLCMSKS